MLAKSQTKRCILYTKIFYTDEWFETGTSICKISIWLNKLKDNYEDVYISSRLFSFFFGVPRSWTVTIVIEHTLAFGCALTTFVSFGEAIALKHHLHQSLIFSSSHDPLRDKVYRVQQH